MLDAENIFQFKLTLTDSFPEVWRRILVPDECTLGDLHYVISYSFCWFQDSEHEFSQGSRRFGPKGQRAQGVREDEHRVLGVNTHAASPAPTTARPTGSAASLGTTRSSRPSTTRAPGRRCAPSSAHAIGSSVSSQPT
ncbi:MAG: hypothetical protein WBM74_19395 [Polyangiales bacterium]